MYGNRLIIVWEQTNESRTLYTIKKDKSVFGHMMTRHAFKNIVTSGGEKGSDRNGKDTDNWCWIICDGGMGEYQ